MSLFAETWALQKFLSSRRNQRCLTSSWKLKNFTCDIFIKSSCCYKFSINISVVNFVLYRSYSTSLSIYFVDDTIKPFRKWQLHLKASAKAHDPLVRIVAIIASFFFILLLKNIFFICDTHLIDLYYTVIIEYNQRVHFVCLTYVSCDRLLAYLKYEIYFVQLKLSNMKHKYQLYCPLH